MTISASVRGRLGREHIAALALALVTYGALERNGSVHDAELKALKALAGARPGASRSSTN